MENIIEEEWKEIPNTKGYYISNFGRAKIDKSQKYPNGTIKEKDDFYIDKDGYYRFSYRTLDGKNSFEPVHRLVAKLFIPNDNPKKFQVNHIDSNRYNNRVDNLEWVTPKENVYHSFMYGNRKKSLEVPRTSRLTSYQVSQIKFLRQFYSLKKISDLFNVPYSTMKNISIKLKRLSKDYQQPSIYSQDWHQNEGSTTISQESTQKANVCGNALPNENQ